MSEGHEVTVSANHMTELGALPQGWTSAQFIDVATLQRGKDLTRQNQSGGDFPVVASSGIIGFHNECTCPDGGVVVGRSGSIGKLTFVERGFWAHNTVLYVKDFHGNNPKFVFYMLHKVDFKRYSSGVSVPTLNRNLIHPIWLPVPPIAEQGKIATILSAVQEAKVKTENVIKAATELKKSLMKYLFTYGAIPANEAENIPQKETEIGTVPDHWNVVKFGDVVNIGSGQVDPKTEPYSKMLHIAPENIEEGTGRVFKLKTAEELKLISGKYAFAPNDVLYSKIRPYLRKATLAPIHGTCSADMYVLTSTVLIHEYLFLWLLTDAFTNQAVSYQDRTGIPKINRQQLDSTWIAVPPKLEQKSIVDILLTCSRKIESEYRQSSSLTSAFDSLLHNLMTGKVRVNGLEV